MFTTGMKVDAYAISYWISATGASSSIPLVFLASEYAKIFNRVVGSVAVNVVYDFIGRNWAIVVDPNEAMGAMRFAMDADEDITALRV